MIEIIRQLLQEHEHDVNILKHDDFIEIYDGVYPEDCVKITKGKQKYLIIEVHRNRQYIRRETSDKNKAAVYAAVLWRSFFFDVPKCDNRKKVEQYVERGDEAKARDILMKDFESSLFSIDKEYRNKLSLLKSGDMANIKFEGEFIASNEVLSVAYRRLYILFKNMYD